MKTKFYKPIYTLFLLAGVLLISLTQCKKVGSSDWPEPNPETVNELKIAVYDGNQGDLLDNLEITVIAPDGIMSEYSSENGKLSVQGNQVGSYIITASKSGYLTQSSIVEIEDTPDNIIGVTKQNFYLNQIGTTSIISVSGTTIAIDSDFDVSPTITFPEGAVSASTELTITYIPSPAKFGDFTVVGERAIQSGFNFSEDLTFPENAKPVLEMPVTIQSVINGDASMLLGNFNENTQEWEIIEGELNEDRSMVTFEIPHFSFWYSFADFRMVKEEGWTPYELSGQSENCSEGACGTYVYAVNAGTLVADVLDGGWTVDLKAVDTRCIGPHYQYAQQLFTRCKFYSYEIFGPGGNLLYTVIKPTEIFNWKVEESYCHHQGWGG